MVLEILLLSVVLMCGYQGQLLLRRGGRAQRPYALMLLGDMAVALIAYETQKRDPDGRLAATLSVVAIGVFVFLVMIPPIIRDLARRALERDRLALAIRLLGLRELLQPGLGARQEREDVEMFAAVRSGKADDLLRDMRSRRATMDDPAQKNALDERIVLMLLYARRWAEAIEHFERTLGQGTALGSPQLLVELVRAYAEEGQLERSAELLDLLEQSPMARQPVLAFLLNRARMVFLAFLGRSGDVDVLCAPGGVLAALAPAVRAYWSGVARWHAGDREGARASLKQAIELSGRDPRARAVAVERLAAFEAAGDAPALPARSPAVEEFADRIAKVARTPVGPADPDRVLPRLEGSIRKLAPVTTGIIIANVAVAMVLVLVAGYTAATSDAGILSLAGAHLKAEVRAGAFWRLESSTFLHLGPLHLFLNMYMLYVLGKLVEQIFGGRRMFVLYTFAGIAGSVASLLFGGDNVSLGASGAVFGVLGAAIAELALRRGVYPEGWRRALLGNLLFVAVANLAIGAKYAMIDQSAHIGGFVMGGLLGALLSPRARFGRGAFMRRLSQGLAVLSVLAIAYSAWGVSSTVFRSSWRQVTLAGVIMDVPPHWLRAADDTVLAPHLGQFTMRVDVALKMTMTPESFADAEAAGITDELEHDGHFAAIESVSTPTVTPPSGWLLREHRTLADLPEGREVYRSLSFTRPFGPRGIAVVFFVPETRVWDIAKVAPRILASVR